MRKSIVGARRLIVPGDVDDRAVWAALGVDGESGGHLSTWTSDHHDSADLEITRRGITIERVRPSRTAPYWCAQFPLLSLTPSMGGPRLERTWPIEDEALPADLAAAIAALASAPLALVATTRTRRRTVRPTGDDHSGATIHLDTVQLLEGRKVAATVRLVEIEPGETSRARDLDALAAAALHLGATPPPGGGTVLAAILGAPACRPAGPIPPPLVRSSDTADLVTAALVTDVQLLLHHWPLLHLAPTSRTVHSSRVALRRYRSHLRVFAPLLDDDRSGALSARLGRLAASLGPVRELDVLGELVGDVGLLLDDADRPALGRLLDDLTERRSAALTDLAAAVAADEARATVLAAIEMATAPPIVTRADEPAQLVVTDLARRAWRQLATAAVLRDDTSPAAALHDLRLLAKRARYATEVAGRIRPAAARHAVELRRLQTILGDINDVDVATAQLRMVAAEIDDAEISFVSGVLVGELHRRGERRRTAWTAQWDRTRRKGIRGWLSRS